MLILERTVEITHLVCPCTHAVEHAAVYDLRPERDRDRNVQESGNALHLVVEIGFEVVVIDEEDVGLATALPPRGDMVHRWGSGNPAIKELVDVAMKLHQRVDILCGCLGVEASVQVSTHMRHMVGVGYEGVWAISGDHDVAGGIKDRDSAPCACSATTPFTQHARVGAQQL